MLDKRRLREEGNKAAFAAQSTHTGRSVAVAGCGKGRAAAPSWFCQPEAGGKRAGRIVGFAAQHCSSTLQLFRTSPMSNAPSALDDSLEDFFGRLRLSLERGEFERLVLAGYRGGEPDLQRILVRPVALLLSLPFIIGTLGIFILVVNAIMLELAGGMVAGFRVNGFGNAFVGALIISFVSWILSLFFKAKGGRIQLITHHEQYQQGGMKQVEGRVIE